MHAPLLFAVGPEDTPYAFGFFVFDVFFPPGEPLDQQLELLVSCMAHIVAAQAISPAGVVCVMLWPHDMLDCSRLSHHCMAIARPTPCLHCLGHSVLVQIIPAFLRSSFWRTLGAALLVSIPICMLMAKVSPSDSLTHLTLPPTAILVQSKLGTSQKHCSLACAYSSASHSTACFCCSLSKFDRHLARLRR